MENAANVSGEPKQTNQITNSNNNPSPEKKKSRNKNNKYGETKGN